MTGGETQARPPGSARPAGAGLGAIIGFGAGIKRAVEAHRHYKTRYEQCMATRAEPAGESPARSVDTAAIDGHSETETEPR